MASQISKSANHVESNHGDSVYYCVTFLVFVVVRLILKLNGTDMLVKGIHQSTLSRLVAIISHFS